MTPERLLAAESLFLQALEQPASERNAWVRGMCGGDEALRSDVERLLLEDRSGETWVRRAVEEAVAAGGGSAVGPGAWAWLLYTSPRPRDRTRSPLPPSA